jgi:hypothetical protein
MDGSGSIRDRCSYLALGWSRKFRCVICSRLAITLIIRVSKRLPSTVSGERASGLKELVGLSERDDGGGNVRWFFLASFVAALVICAVLSSFIVFALATRGAGGLRVVWIFLPQLALFGWAAREMFRSFKNVRLNQ